ncbi:phage holin family protein [Mycolicibacterium phlei]|jgi:uncharacterized protein (DUF58 family)|uniref:phage holin family protein n=1 Tax=Mycolicibacterium phlei TaxID=1771 RepID=UPI00025AE420|nr:phage holin family protein [Mycolicibacterium phlei]EID14245.1 hypothetical protein MPHLEI_11774 [Mycolicibacterium phlei RIVM601174]MBF4195862.1 hypothetical protein [Mycolicibacterium phlei]
MLIVALVLAVIGLAALVTAVVTSNELIAWVCIAASVIGVLLLIVDAVRERSRGKNAQESEAPAVEHNPEVQYYEDYPDDEVGADETGTEETIVETSTEPGADDTTVIESVTEETTVIETPEAQTPESETPETGGDAGR